LGGGTLVEPDGSVDAAAVRAAFAEAAGTAHDEAVRAADDGVRG
jgi:hypothetical protein